MRPDEIDRGLSASITLALRDAGIEPGDIDAVFALGIGQTTLDEMELGAIRQALGERSGSVPIASLAHITGNTMAGHAGLLAAAGALCLKNQQIPAVMVTRNHESSNNNLRRVLVCSPSLGGQAATLVLERVE